MKKIVVGCVGIAALLACGIARGQSILVDVIELETGLQEGWHLSGNRSDAAASTLDGSALIVLDPYPNGGVGFFQFDQYSGESSFHFQGGLHYAGAIPVVTRQGLLSAISVPDSNLSRVHLWREDEDGWRVVETLNVPHPCLGPFNFFASIARTSESMSGVTGAWFAFGGSYWNHFAYITCARHSMLEVDGDSIAQTSLSCQDESWNPFLWGDSRLIVYNWEEIADGQYGFVESTHGGLQHCPTSRRVVSTDAATNDRDVIEVQGTRMLALSSLDRASSGYLLSDLRVYCISDDTTPTLSLVSDTTDSYHGAFTSNSTGSSVETKDDFTEGVHISFQDMAYTDGQSLDVYVGQWRTAYLAPGSTEWVVSTLYRQRSPHLSPRDFQVLDTFGFNVSPGGGFVSTLANESRVVEWEQQPPDRLLHLRAINFQGSDLFASPTVAIGVPLGLVDPGIGEFDDWVSNDDGAIDVADYIGR